MLIHDRESFIRATLVVGPYSLQYATLFTRVARLHSFTPRMGSAELVASVQPADAVVRIQP